ncbi:MAG TPA: 4-alpha-glucanotransferase [Pyrinomonadaceae bacterium]|jgi:4-alpha-glucanotransferase|nr:4-alpha-glucanotransferase [Pyrinomonadaceae bacterium]
MAFLRASGVLLHLTSLPGRYGIGDMGAEARGFIDFLAAGGQTYWQILPLNPTDYGDSPYQCFSTFAGNTLLIDPAKLEAEGFLSAEEIEEIPGFSEGTADYGGAIELKSVLLRKAFERFRVSKKEELRGAYEVFCSENSNWLDDYALFQAIRNANELKPWNEWDESLAKRDEEALNNARGELEEEIYAQKFYQFLFFKQWNELRAYAQEKGVKFIGDVPIYVSHNSADVWCNPRMFKLNEDGSSAFVAGVPPDAFSSTGQLWGNPIYDWDEMRNENFAWWIERIRFTLKTVDITRIDHFRGFYSYWEVPGENETAEHGEWVDVPGYELFGTLKDELGELPFIVEDLGYMTPEIYKMRDDLGYPGMRILQFAFGGDAKHNDLPHNYVHNCAAYTGTHDNETAAGWYQAQFDKEGKISIYGERCLKYLGSTGEEIHWDMIRAVLASVADTAIIPAQDLLGLGNEARMNLPATTDGNWKWRLKPGELSDEIAGRLKEMTEIYGRS